MKLPARARDLGLACGSLPTGELNSIADVPGVRVGHCTLVDGEIRTGVTAVIPHGGNLYREKPVAAVHVLNGFGKSAGLVQVEELGTIETPILSPILSLSAPAGRPWCATPSSTILTSAARRPP